MRYIRTKDGLIFTVVETIDKSKWNHSYKYLYRIKEIERSSSRGSIIVDTNVVEQADTIEELCDEFVLQGTTKLGTRFDTLNEAKTYKADCDTLYGAIWTDKGLIYVAKMNDKGELELL